MTTYISHVTRAVRITTLVDVSTTCTTRSQRFFSRGDRRGGCVLFVGLITPNGAYFLDLFVPAPLTYRPVIIIERTRLPGVSSSTRTIVLRSALLLGVARTPRPAALSLARAQKTI